GKVIGGATQAVIEGALLLLVGWLFVPQLAWANLPLVFVFVVLTAILFTSFGLAMGSYFTSFEGFRVTSTFIAFPVFFLSGALFPITGLPTWLTLFTKANPLTYSVDAIRGLLVGGLQLSLLTDFLVLSGFTLVAVLFGGWSFNRMKD
ncbi:MAG: ABC transporter permease, partial [Candidatus Thermoplasmatota archaeon]|nr:ABC transporter permease [Candidatus Thermoplasmatota archaeon]